MTDFKKLSKNPSDIADIMLHYVEQGTRFTDEYGDIDEPFYNSMESMYETALKFIVTNKLVDQFQDRCFVIKEEAIEGWGFKDQLGDLFETIMIEVND